MVSPPVALLFPSIGAAGGYDSDGFLGLPVAMAHYQNPKPCTQAKQQESILVIRMIRVIVDGRLLVIKRRSSLLE